MKTGKEGDTSLKNFIETNRSWRMDETYIKVKGE
jgi:transposase-like protein